jgi:hypothetical protein
MSVINRAREKDSKVKRMAIASAPGVLTRWSQIG